MKDSQFLPKNKTIETKNLAFQIKLSLSFSRKRKLRTGLDSILAETMESNLFAFKFFYFLFTITSGKAKQIFYLFKINNLIKLKADSFFPEKDNASKMA